MSAFCLILSPLRTRSLFPNIGRILHCYMEDALTDVVIGLIPASFAACVVIIHIIWVVVRDLIQENVDFSLLLGTCSK